MYVRRSSVWAVGRTQLHPVALNAVNLFLGGERETAGTGDLVFGSALEVR